MELNVEWLRPVLLKDGTRENLIYTMDPDRLPQSAGIYVFGRRWGRKHFEALYVGKANHLRGRVTGQFNNLKLMQHLRNAKGGRRIILAGEFIAKPGQQLKKCLTLIERALIRHFLSEGHDLVNLQGTRIRRHEIKSDGKPPKAFLPGIVYLERPKGE
jgi:hypothetical protein